MARRIGQPSATVSAVDWVNGEPLAEMIPIRRRRAVPKEEVLAIMATAPMVDADELRAELEDAVGEDLRDPYEGTAL